MTIALIGAGAAGAACLSVLRSRGAEFFAFEKSRGVGGRLTTRRSTLQPESLELSYDHGAPKFELSTPTTEALRDHLQPSTLKSFGNDYVSSPTMPQLVKDLLGTSHVHTQTEISSIRGDTHSWWLIEKTKEDSQSSARSFGPFSKVIITAPAPQALALLSGVVCSWQDNLRRVTYAPCWALMLSLRNATAASFVHPTPTFAGFYLQNLKPGRAPPGGVQSWVAHATTEWSIQNLDRKESEVAEHLLGAALKTLNAQHEQVIHSAVHRWRYSTVTQAVGLATLCDDDTGLYYAGDGCLGEGLEGALRSGLTLGHHLLRGLSPALDAP